MFSKDNNYVNLWNDVKETTNTLCPDMTNLPQKNRSRNGDFLENFASEIFPVNL